MGNLRERLQSIGTKKTIIISAAVLALSTSLVWYTGLFGSKTPPAQAAAAAVRRGDIRVTVSGAGTVSGILEQNIAAKVGGTITSIGFKAGSQVKQGDILFQLENTSVQQKLAVSDLSLKQAQFDYSQSAQDLTKLNVTAPFAGLITALNVKEGDEVSKGAPLLTLVDNREMELIVTFNEQVAKSILPGQTADVFLQDYLISVPGRVSYVSNAGQPDGSGAILTSVKIAVDNQGGLSPGLKASATVHTAAGDLRGLTQNTLQYRNTSTITAVEAGIVTGIYVQQNDEVERGQKILEVSSDLVLSDVTTKQLKQQQALIDAETAKTDYNNLTIMAPFDGVLVKLGKNQGNDSNSNSNSTSSSSTSSTDQALILGEEVKAGDVIAKVANYDQMEVTVQIDEIDITRVALGQKANITADALPNRQYQGEVVAAGSEGVSQNGVASFDVTLRIDKPEGLKAGMTVNADILVAEKTNVLLIPIEALQDRQGKKFVIPAGADNEQTASSGKNSLREVQVGLNNETNVEITGGLKEGDQVLVPSAQRSNINSNQPRGTIPGMGMGGMRPTTGGTTRVGR